MHHRVSRIPPSQRRKLVWATFNTEAATTVAGATSSNQDLLGNLTVSGVGIFGGTIMRTHIKLYATCLGTDTSPGAYIGCLVHDKNDTANDPHTDFGADWMLNTVFSPADSGTYITLTALQFMREWDLKSKRRLHEVGDAYHFRLHNTGSQTLTWTLFVKTLVALP